MRRFDDEHADEPPEDLTPWLAEGLRRIEALNWRRWNFDLDEAKEWREVGVGDALTAAQWQTAGVRPDAVDDWVAESITASEAVRWHEFGFDLKAAREHVRNGRGPQEAYEENNRKSQGTATRLGYGAHVHNFMNAGVPHAVLTGYLQTQWTDDEALEWAKLGIQSWDAKLWQMIGLTASEAGELQKSNLDPSKVIKDWWRSGIPFEEVADWLGAGLTPAEAAEQRGSGITVEQAAALRALRRGGAL